MSQIIYPCETAAIFQGVIFVIHPQHVSELLSEADRATEFYLNHFPYASIENIREGIRYSFWGLYLTDDQLIREAS